MAHEDPNREFHDELLSAYLDGELSDAERARVEERLAVDPLARQVLEELRSVSAAMRNLPAEKLGADFRSAVLQRAEELQAAASAPVERPTATGASANGREPASRDPAGEPFRTVPRFSVGRTRRGWVWAALAVAAAIFIMIVQPEQPRDDSQPSVARRELKEVEFAEGRRSGVPELRAPSSGALAWFGEGEEDSSSAAPTRPAVDAGVPLATTTNQPAPLFRGDRSGVNELDEVSLGVRLRGIADKATDASARPDAVAAAQAGAGSAVQPPAAATTAAADGVRTEMYGFGMRGGSAPAAPGEQAAAGLAQSAPAVGGQTAADWSVVREEAVRRSAPTLGGSVSESSRERSELLVVYVDVKADALAEGAFDRTLTSNQISFESAPRTAEGDRMFLAYEAGIRDRAVLPPASDIVLVEAPPANIERVIRDLDGDSENIVGISVDRMEESGAPSDQLASVDWSRYRRVVVPDELRDQSESDELPTEANRGGRGGGRFGGGGFGNGELDAGGFGGGRGGRAAGISGRGGGGGAGQATRGRGRGGRGGARGRGATQLESSSGEAKQQPTTGADNDDRGEAVSRTPVAGMPAAAADERPNAARGSTDQRVADESNRKALEIDANQSLEQQLTRGTSVDAVGRAMRVYAAAPMGGNGQTFRDAPISVDPLPVRQAGPEGNRGVLAPGLGARLQASNEQKQAGIGTANGRQEGAGEPKLDLATGEMLFDLMDRSEPRPADGATAVDAEQLGRLQESAARTNQSLATTDGLGGTSPSPSPLRVLFLLRAAPSAEAGAVAPATSVPAANPAK